MPTVGETRTNPNNPSETATWNGRQWVIATGGVAQRSTAARPPRRSAGDERTIREAREASEAASQSIASVGNFQELNRRQWTGGVLAIPGVAPAMAAFNPEIAGMRAITARIAPQQRVPNSGTTSDRDLSLFIQAGPDVGRPREANDLIISQARSEAARRRARSAWLERWAQRRGNLDGAQAAFDQWWASQSPPPQAPQQRPRYVATQGQARYLQGAHGAPGSRTNPMLINPADEAASLRSVRRGQWYVTPSGELLRRGG